MSYLELVVPWGVLLWCIPFSCDFVPDFVRVCCDQVLLDIASELQLSTSLPPRRSHDKLRSGYKYRRLRTCWEIWSLSGAHLHTVAFLSNHWYWSGGCPLMGNGLWWFPIGLPPESCPRLPWSSPILVSPFRAYFWSLPICSKLSSSIGSSGSYTYNSSSLRLTVSPSMSRKEGWGHSFGSHFCTLVPLDSRLSDADQTHVLPKGHCDFDQAWNRWDVLPKDHCDFAKSKKCDTCYRRPSIMWNSRSSFKKSWQFHFSGPRSPWSIPTLVSSALHSESSRSSTSPALKSVIVHRYLGALEWSVRPSWWLSPSPTRQHANAKMKRAHENKKTKFKQPFITVERKTENQTIFF